MAWVLLLVVVFHILDSIIINKALLSVYVFSDEQVSLLVVPLAERPGAPPVHGSVHNLLPQIVLEKLQFASLATI
jgi:hypothetical protein